PGSRRYQPLRLEPARARRQKGQGYRGRRGDDRRTDRAPGPLQREGHRRRAELHPAVHSAERPTRDHVPGGPRGPVRARAPDPRPALVAQRHGAERGRGPHQAGARSARGAVGEARQRARRVARHRDGGSRGLQSNAARPERARRGRGGRQALMFDAIVLVATLLGGGDTLSGRAADPDGNAVAGATAPVVELHRVAVTQADGAYRLADLPPGRYTISVRGLGFAPLARDVAVRGATTLSVT